MLERQRQMTEEFIPKLTALSPESGAYMNEVCKLIFSSNFLHYYEHMLIVLAG